MAKTKRRKILKALQSRCLQLHAMWQIRSLGWHSKEDKQLIRNYIKARVKELR